MKIAPGLHSIGDESGGHVRAFLVEDADGSLILIDTGKHEDGRLILEELRGMGKKPEDITRIVLTHGHPSHLGGAASLKSATRACVYSHNWEVDVIECKRKPAVPKSTGIWPQKPRVLYKFQLGLKFGLGIPPACQVDENMKDGDVIGPMTVIHTPGHTPGSMSFYLPKQKALIVGDIVSTWPELALGWPMITLDNKENRESVGKLCDMVDAGILCVGHGAPVIEGGAQVMRDLVAGRKTTAVLAKS
jgi:glyoxylase-like metal-dependent hydrolase (beta-lactamase superfamily II)